MEVLKPRARQEVVSIVVVVLLGEDGRRGDRGRRDELLGDDGGLS